MKPRNPYIPGMRTFETSEGVSTINTFAAAYNRFEPGTDTNTGNRGKPHPQSFLKSGGNTALEGFQEDSWTDGSGRWERYRGDGIYPFYNAAAMNRDDSLRNVCISRINSKIRGDTDLSVDFFSAKKTAQMISGLGKAIRSYKDTFDRMKVANLRDIGSIWLEGTYGWMPTIQTVYDTFNKFMQPGCEWIRVAARAGSKRQVSGVTTAYGIPHKTVVESQDRYQIVMGYAPQPSLLTALAGYTSLNPVSIAWELLPYSFVADWFIDIGGYLRNTETALIYGNVVLDYGYSTQTQLVTVTESIQGAAPLSSNVLRTMSVSGSQWSKSKERLTFTSWPSPTPPKFDPKLGTSRLISAASLLSQQISSWEVRLPREHRFR